jgi:hypothetical protein
MYGSSQFFLSVEPKHGNTKYPLMIDLFDLLEKALIKALSQLKSKFNLKRDRQHQLYITLVDPESIIDGIRTFNMSEKRSAKDMARRVMNNFYSFTVSNADTSISKGFGVYIKYLSYDESEKHRTQELIGSNEIELTKKTPTYLFDPLSVECPSYPRIFRNLCLLVATIAGVFLNRGNAIPIADEQCKKLFARPDKVPKRKFCLMALKELKRLRIAHPKFKGPGPFQLDDLSDLASFYESQIVVFTDKRPFLKKMFPFKRNPRLPIIYLFIPSDNISLVKHVYLISSIEKYFRNEKFTCLFCFKSHSSYRTYLHGSGRCSRKCFACGRFLKLFKDDYEDSASNLCDSKIEDAPDYYSTCPECNIFFTSKSCEEHHIRSICKRGFFCDACKTYQSVSGKYRNLSSLKENHNCGEKKCAKCKNIFMRSENHQCSILPIRELQELSNIGFVDVQFYSTSGNCPRCLESPCSDHQILTIDELIPFSCSLVLEREKKEKFKTIIFGGFFENSAENSFNMEYIPKCFQYKSELSDSNHRQRFGNTTAKLNESFQRDILKLAKKSNPNPVEQVMLYLLQNCTHYSFLCSSQETIDIFLKYFLLNNFIITGLFSNGLRSRCFEIKEKNLKFICYQEYLQSSLTSLTKALLPDSKIPIFPIQLIHEKHFSYEGCVPKFNFFLGPFDTVETIQNKEKSYKMLCENPNIWNWKQAFLQYAKSFIEQFSTIFLIFLSECLNFQRNCKLIFGKETAPGKLEFISPFDECFNLQQFAFNSFQFFCLEPNAIKQINNPDGKKPVASNPEMIFALFQEKLYPGAIHNFSSNKSVLKQKFGFCGCIPDIYVPKHLHPFKKEVCFMFNGCAIHGHSSVYCPYAKKSGDFILFGKTARQRQNEFENKVSRLKKAFPEIVVIVEWQCVFEAKCKNAKHKSKLQLPSISNSEEALKEFLEKPLRTFQGLIPRECNKGCINELFSFYWVQSGTEVFEALDAVSFYTSQALSKEFPVNNYDFFSESDIPLDKVECVSGKFFFNNKQILGAALATMLCPDDIFLPVLHCKIGDRNVLARCQVCAAQKSSVCEHDKNQRSICGNFLLDEIAYAVSQGYEILAIHEMMAYKNKSFLFRKFYLLLSYFTMKHSKVPENVPKQIFCDTLNKKVGYKDIELSLSVDTLEPCPRKRLLYKNLANKALGKLLQNNANKMRTDFVRTEAELIEKFLDGNLLDFREIADNICEVNLAPLNNLAQKANCILGAYVTFYGRMEMHKTITSLQKKDGIKLYLVNNDAIYFSRPKSLNLDSAISLGFCPGEFSPIYQGNILSFITLSPKSYAISWESDSDKQLKEDIKISGLSHHASVKHQMSFSDIEKAYEKLLHDKVAYIKTVQVRTQRCKKSKMIRLVKRRSNFAFSLSERRRIIIDEFGNLSTQSY